MKTTTVLESLFSTQKLQFYCECFAVNITKSLSKAFFIERLWWLRLEGDEITLYH